MTELQIYPNEAFRDGEATAEDYVSDWEDNASLTEEYILYVFEEAPLFKIDWYRDITDDLDIETTDTVSGLSEILIYKGQLREEMEDEDGNVSHENISEQRLNEILPTVEEIAQYGDVFDRFLCRYMRYEW